jgi:hypothetical protein
MGPTSSISTLFLDIGGVLLTNGWDHNIHARAAEKFGLDYEEMNERHHLTFDTYEEGKLSLDEAVDGAADRLANLIESTLGRQHDQELRRTDPPLPEAKSEEIS